MNPVYPRILIPAVVLLVAAIGCDSGTGPRRYNVSGTVTYDGKPVPGGRILFVPDAQQNNSGPGSVADIVNGSYATRPGKGVGGGPYRATIYGTDGTPATESRDNSLFPPFETTLSLPDEDCRHDFAVPTGRTTASVRPL